jgi:hypothetical protein
LPSSIVDFAPPEAREHLAAFIADITLDDGRRLVVVGEDRTFSCHDCGRRQYVPEGPSFN